MRALAFAAAVTLAPMPAKASDWAPGEKLTMVNCGRCHVIGPRNRMGGIGSTPSFAALKALPDWREKFERFYLLNPHPSFTRIEGISPPFDKKRPPHVAPVVLTEAELEEVMRFVEGVKAKDLGAELR